MSWYEESSRLGEIGNILMAGHSDYWDVGPAVLYNINNLNEGDLIQVTGEDGVIYTYRSSGERTSKQPRRRFRISWDRPMRRV
ncbi:MAG: class F sortase [Thermomicrobiales bacterium]